MHSERAPIKIAEHARTIFFQEAFEAGEVMMINAGLRHVSQLAALLDHLNDRQNIISDCCRIAFIRFAHTEALRPRNQGKPSDVELINDVSAFVRDDRISAAKM